MTSHKIHVRPNFEHPRHLFFGIRNKCGEVDIDALIRGKIVRPKMQIFNSDEPGAYRLYEKYLDVTCEITSVDEKPLPCHGWIKAHRLYYFDLAELPGFGISKDSSIVVNFTTSETPEKLQFAAIVVDDFGIEHIYHSIITN